MLTDALLLACCKTILHMASNVTPAVALLAPEANMMHIADVLGCREPQALTPADMRRLARATIHRAEGRFRP